MRVRITHWMAAIFLALAGCWSATALGQSGTAGEVSARVYGPQELAVMKLDGIWAGVGYLDQEKLTKQLESMPEGDAKEILMHKAGTFLSIVAAMEFRADGQLETDMEITGEDGEVVREPTIGTWKIIEVRDSRRLVELNETLDDKSERSTRQLIQFYEDGQHIAVVIESDPALADFNPLIVMERVPAEKIAKAEAAHGPKFDR